jgi:hypothetical protein
MDRDSGRIYQCLHMSKRQYRKGSFVLPCIPVWIFRAGLPGVKRLRSSFPRVGFMRGITLICNNKTVAVMAPFLH